MSSKQTYILFIFEGAKTEPSIMRSLEEHFLNERKQLSIKAVYGTAIYTFYQQFLCAGVFDDDLDTFVLAQEFNAELKELERDQVAEIYLFFDYDKQASNANDDALKDMLNRFNNETEKGKLYISYPMVEALKHLHSEVGFQYVKGECKKGYKALVEKEGEECFKHFSRYDEEVWHEVISQHAMKANYITWISLDQI